MSARSTTVRWELTDHSYSREDRSSYPHIPKAHKIRALQSPDSSAYDLWRDTLNLGERSLVLARESGDERFQGLCR